MARRACRIAFCLILAVCFVNLSLCDSLQLTEEDLKKWENYQHVSAVVKNMVIPSASTEDGELVELPKSWEQHFPGSASSICTLDLFRALTSLNETWAMKMLDSDAKPPSGIMDLKMNWMGDYYECQNVRAPATNYSSGFSGRYCTFQLSANISNASLSLIAGLCMPSSCTPEELMNLTNLAIIAGRSIMKEFAVSSVKVKVTSCAIENSFDAAAIGMMFLLSVFLLLMAAGTSTTLLDRWRITRRHDRSVESSSITYSIIDGLKADANNIQEVVPNEDYLLKKFLKCFCMITNGSKILSTDAKGDLGCVHGIRFLSMTWVILGHTYLTAASLVATGNVREMLDSIDNLPFQALVQGTFSVDSFFLLSGFLLSYLFLREAFAKDGKIPWGFFYIHRYWRLTPVYAVVIGFNTSLTMYVSDGPLWPSGSNDPNCRTSWWWNLLYINNFRNMTESCMAWSWYLANDMQFYIISPIFLYLLWRWPKIGLSLISGVVFSSWIATGWICYHYQLMPQSSSIADLQTLASGQKLTDYFQMIYVKPYTRIGPYVIGIVLGYAVFHQMRNRKPITKIVQLVGWALSLAGGLGMVYGFYHVHLSVTEYSILIAVNRSIFAASLAWVIFVCLSGCGGPINVILSWNFLIPLSRLTYCAYLVHPIIVGSFFQSLRAPIQTTHSFIVTLFLGLLMMSYATALVCSLAFESSLMALEKLGLSYFKKIEQKS